MLSVYWPLVGLRVETPRLSLRPIREDDLATLATLLPGDVETDPRLPRYGPPETSAGTALCVSYWASMGSWRIEHWRLGLVARLDGEPVGVQEIEAEQFPARGTVETASWLVTAQRGHGLGQEMRVAALTLAFDGLGALAAETEAWHDNLASLGVSTSVGYRPNGETLWPRGATVDQMTRMRITAEQWAATRQRTTATVTGLDACRQLFGDPPTQRPGTGS